MNDSISSSHFRKCPFGLKISSHSLSSVRCNQNLILSDMPHRTLTIRTTDRTLKETPNVFKRVGCAPDRALVRSSPNRTIWPTPVGLFHSSSDFSPPTATYLLPSPSSLNLCCRDCRCMPSTEAARVTLPPASSKQRAM